MVDGEESDLYALNAMQTDGKLTNACVQNRNIAL